MFSVFSTKKLSAFLIALLACAPVTIIMAQENGPAAPANSDSVAVASSVDPGIEQAPSEQPAKMPTRIYRTRQPVDGFSAVEMFSAMETGEIEVKLIPKDATESTIFVTNNSDQPLAVEMPEAFAGMPVLAQGGFGGGGGGFGGGGGGIGGGGGGRGGGQGFGGGAGGGGGGGGFGGGGAGGGGGGLGGGAFCNIPPGKRGRIKVTTVCLEFNKNDPRPGMEYEIRPIEDLTTDPAIIEICKMLANDEISQKVGQAAAWHRTDNMSWEALLNHDKVRLSNGYFERFFTPQQVYWAREVVAAANQRAHLAGQTREQSDEAIRSWQTPDGAGK